MKKFPLFLMFFLILSSVFAQERGFKPVTEVTGKNSSEIEDSYHALIIGNNDYKDAAINDLDNPISDAQTKLNIEIEQNINIK